MTIYFWRLVTGEQKTVETEGYLSKSVLGFLNTECYGSSQGSSYRDGAGRDHLSLSLSLSPSLSLAPSLPLFLNK